MTIDSFGEAFSLMWYYLDQAKQQQGPVEDSQLSALLAGGTITPQTFIWREGMPNWASVDQAFLSPATSAAATCQICHKAVGADNLIELAGVKVCADCKPTAVQTLREGVPLGNDVVWRDGKKIVAKDKAHFPARCVKCNSPAAGPPLKRKLYWHNPLFYLLIFIQIFLYVIVAIIVRKRASAEIYLCAEHLKRRKYFIAGAWATVAVGIIVGIMGAAYSYTLVAVLGFFLGIVGGAVMGIVGGQALRTIKIKDKTVWLAGGGKEFLASLPEWMG